MVGTSRDTGLLLPEGGELDDAVVANRLDRFKLRGRWLYTESGASIEQILEEAERVAASCLDEWLLGTNPFLRNAAAKRSRSPDISHSAMDVLIRELCIRDRLRGLGLINQQYQPHLAVHAPSDGDEVARQLAALRELLERYGRLHWRDLPDPERVRPGKAWRMVMLAHAEFLGLGWLANRQELIAW